MQIRQSQLRHGQQGKTKKNIIASGIAGHNVAAASSLAGKWGSPSSKKILQNDSNQLALFDISLLSSRTTKWPKWPTTFYCSLRQTSTPSCVSNVPQWLDLYWAHLLRSGFLTPHCTLISSELQNVCTKQSSKRIPEKPTIRLLLHHETTLPLLAWPNFVRWLPKAYHIKVCICTTGMSQTVTSVSILPSTYARSQLRRSKLKICRIGKLNYGRLRTPKHELTERHRTHSVHACGLNDSLISTLGYLNVPFPARSPLTITTHSFSTDTFALDIILFGCSI